MRTTMIVSALCVAAGWLAAADRQRVTFDFTGGKDAPNLLEDKGKKLDGRNALSQGPRLLFSLAPQDRVTLDVVGRTTFTGKELAHRANFVKIEEESYLVFFSREVRKNHPDPREIERWSRHKPELSVGNRENEIQIWLEVRYKTGAPDRLCYAAGEPIDFILPRPADVYVELKVEPEQLVAWEDRRPNPEEKKVIRGEMERRRRERRFDEAKLLGEMVLKGNVGEVTVRVAGVRGP